MKNKPNISKVCLAVMLAFTSLGLSGCYTQSQMDSKVAEVRTAEKQRCELQIDNLKAENERRIESLKAQYEKAAKEKADSAYWSGLIVGLLVAFGGGIVVIALIGLGVWSAYMSKTYFENK